MPGPSETSRSARKSVAIPIKSTPAILRHVMRKGRSPIRDLPCPTPVITPARTSRICRFRVVAYRAVASSTPQGVSSITVISRHYGGKLTGRYGFHAAICVARAPSAMVLGHQRSRRTLLGHQYLAHCRFVQLAPNSPGAKLLGVDGLKPETSTITVLASSPTLLPI